MVGRTDPPEQVSDRLMGEDIAGAIFDLRCRERLFPDGRTDANERIPPSRR